MNDPAPTPFGPDDTSVLDPARVEQQVAKTRQALRGARDELLRRSYGNSEPRPVTRADGIWPFLLIRTYAGDVGQRPQPPADLPYQGVESPDIIVTSAARGGGGPAVPERADIPAVVARNERMLVPATPYELWVHVWNLGRGAATGVRVRVRQFVPQPPGVPGPQQTYLGGIALDLPEHTHRLVRVLTFVAPEVWSEEQPVLLVATADCFTDPASDDLSPGADRHSATRSIFASLVPF